MDNQPEAIVILGGGMVKNPDGSFRTTNFNEKGDRSGVTGDRLRVEAANYLFKENSNRTIIVSGGQGMMKIGVHPNISTVIKKELIKLGIPENKIIEEDRTNNTYQQLVELKKILKEKEIKDVIMVTNKWHMPRTQLMIENVKEFKDFYKKINLKFLTAEEVALKHDKNKWQRIINDAYSSQVMKERLKLEQNGIKQIKDGTYNYG